MVNDAGSIRLNCFGEIAESIRSIQFELKKIETATSLAEDMEKGLRKDSAQSAIDEIKEKQNA
jgi:U3 small nucleolar ribonucleoprotein component